MAANATDNDIRSANHAEADPDAFARETLRLLGPAPDNWLPQRSGFDHNVLIVGGGQGGCAIAFALRRAGIGGVSVIDAAPGTEEAGVWLTRARMHKLRTPKNLVGPELGITALGFQRWYEARHGREAYAAIDRIPRTDWAAYLAWFRTFLEIDVHYGTRLVGIEPFEGGGAPGLTVRSRVGDTVQTATTRKLILANGVAGNGAPNIPAWLRPAIAAGLAAHTSDPIDFNALKGASVAVIGGAASAFDAAAVALEHGATNVHLFARRKQIAARATAKTRAYPGFYDNFPALPDAVRWRQALRFRRYGSTPPQDAVNRVLAHRAFRLHTGTSWSGATVADGAVRAHWNRNAGAGESSSKSIGELAFDFVIAGTGYTTDPAERAELADIAPWIARWRDRHAPPADERDDTLAASPYLGTGLEYLEKVPGTAPWLGAIHIFNPAGFVSVGAPLGDIPSMRRDIPAIVRRVSHDLFVADLAEHEARASSEVEPDFGPELYAEALWRGEPLGRTSSGE